jgi:hypothetical protein
LVTSEATLPVRSEVVSANHALHLKDRAKMQDWADFLEHTQGSAKVLPFKGTAD